MAHLVYAIFLNKGMLADNPKVYILDLKQILADFLNLRDFHDVWFVYYQPFILCFCNESFKNTDVASILEVKSWNW